MYVLKVDVKDDHIIGTNFGRMDSCGIANAIKPLLKEGAFVGISYKCISFRIGEECYYEENNSVYEFHDQVKCGQLLKDRHCIDVSEVPLFNKRTIVIKSDELIKFIQEKYLTKEGVVNT